MLDLTEKEALALNALQRGVPLAERPFAEIGAPFGMTEQGVLALLKRLKEEESYRRLGAIFDARRLGFRSVLCAADVPEKDLAHIGTAIASASSGVTHCYERGWPKDLPATLPGGPRDNHWPNLWFTLAAPAETFDEQLAAIRRASAPHKVFAFPATKRFKIDVVFDLRTRDRDERTGNPADLSRAKKTLDDDTEVYHATPADMAVIRAMQGDLALTEHLYGPVAKEAGCGEAELLSKLRAWSANGVLRRVGLILRHRKIGFKANGMCCWDLPEADVLSVGRRLAEFPEVTHCYERPYSEIFPFRLYAMIHTTSFRDTQKLFERLSAAAGLKDGQLLLSLREFKKSSLIF